LAGYVLFAEEFADGSQNREYRKAVAEIAKADRNRARHEQMKMRKPMMGART